MCLCTESGIMAGKAAPLWQSNAQTFVSTTAAAFSGALINIHCETNGNIDAMECSFNNTGWFQPKFRYR